MKFFFTVLALVTLLGTISACNKKEDIPPVAKVEQKIIATGQMNDSDRVLAFFAGIQSNDKKLMYGVSNLTPEMVENSRKILTDTVTYKQTKKERVETEHALRMSGTIDFYLKKLTKIIPKSAQFQVIKTTQENKTNSVVKVHHVKIFYSNKDEALTDKKGQRIKEMAIRLQQIDHKVKNQLMHEFLFENRDFEKLADGNFEGMTYY